MPAFPKVFGVRGKIRMVEIPGNLDAQQQGYPRDEVSVAGEIKIDMLRPGVNSN